MTFSISEHGEFFNLQSFLKATIVLVTIIKRRGYKPSWRQQDGLSLCQSLYRIRVHDDPLDLQKINFYLVQTWWSTEKTLWDIRKSGRCMFLTRNWQLIHNDKSYCQGIGFFCCSYSVGCRKGIGFPTSTRKSDLSLHWRFGYEKKLSQLKK